MKKLLLIMAIGLLSTQVSANSIYGKGSYSPIKIVLVKETQGYFGKKFCTYQKFKFDRLISQFTIVVPKGMACPILGPR